jgi:hypothetical protein
MPNTEEEIWVLCQKWKRYALDMIRVMALALAISILILVLFDGVQLALETVMVICGMMIMVACGIYIGVNAIDLETQRNL